MQFDDMARSPPLEGVEGDGWMDVVHDVLWKNIHARLWVLVLLLLHRSSSGAYFPPPPPRRHQIALLISLPIRDAVRRKTMQLDLNSAGKW